jgi:hypothetical protein
MQLRFCVEHSATKKRAASIHTAMNRSRHLQTSIKIEKRDELAYASAVSSDSSPLRRRSAAAPKPSNPGSKPGVGIVETAPT